MMLRPPSVPSRAGVLSQGRPTAGPYLIRFALACFAVTAGLVYFLCVLIRGSLTP